VTPKDQLAFISLIAPLAQASQKQYRIPASVTIAQAIDESGWGQSQLSTKANNFFGIKARQSVDKYTQFNTEEFEKGQPVKELAKFRVFNSLKDCFEAHARLLACTDRYRPAMADADDPFVFAPRLKECGYSTDPEYAKKLAALITDFRLTQYDASDATGLGQTGRGAPAVEK
jgi:flagellum-specific peptidoglycan hydrolase FlgJ